jgi:oligoendopeptidase F
MRGTATMQNNIKFTRWSLQDLMAEPVAQTFDELLLKLEQGLVKYEALRETLAIEMVGEQFQEFLEAQESILTITGRLEGYSDLWFSEDTQNSAALNLKGRIDDALTETSNRMLFFDIWFKELPDAAAERLIAHSGELRYFLEAVRRFKPYTLSEVEEKLINLKDINGIDAMVNLYSMITNHFTFKLEINNETKFLTKDELGNYFRHPSPEIRAAAYQELYRVFGDNATVLAQIYVHRVRDWHTEGVDLRGYATPITARNVGNDLPDAVVDTLLSICRKNAGVFQRYFKIKARWLGLDKLRRYDIYAPLTKSDKQYDYATAIQMVMDSYRAFSPQIAELAARVLEENHIDSETRTGKRGGAFCYTAIPELTPWVLVNYAGSANDVATLAHELGHAIHFILAGNHSILDYRPSLPLAETASVFAEMQLTEQLLKHETEASVRRDLLVNALDGAYVTVMRQAYLTIFERTAHEMIADGKTIEEVTEKYVSNLQEQFGDALDVTGEFQMEWITIPHFYNTPFYPYAYSFGQLLVLALYQQYRLEGESFIPKYLKILAYGGSESPIKILAEAGLDISSPSFWQGGFDVIERMITELDQLS